MSLDAGGLCRSKGDHNRLQAPQNFACGSLGVRDRDRNMQSSHSLRAKHQPDNPTTRTFSTPFPISHTATPSSTTFLSSNRAVIITWATGCARLHQMRTCDRRGFDRHQLSPPKNKGTASRRSTLFVYIPAPGRESTSGTARRPTGRRGRACDTRGGRRRELGRAGAKRGVIASNFESARRCAVGARTGNISARGTPRAMAQARESGSTRMRARVQAKTAVKGGRKRGAHGRGA